MKVSEEELQNSIDLASATVSKRYGLTRAQSRSSEQFSDALLGIAFAYEQFDPCLGTKFTTYCYRAILWYIVTGERRRKKERMRQVDQEILDCLGSRPLEVDKRRTVEWILGLYPTDTPRHRRKLDILRRLYLDGETSASVGRSYGVSDVAINQQRDLAIRELKALIKGRELPIWMY